MAAPTQPTSARRSRVAPRAASWLAALWLVTPWGCLNPWPDDYPSSNDSAARSPSYEGPVAEPPPVVPSPSDDCDTNPLDVSCGSPNSGNAAEEDPDEHNLSRPPPDAGAADAGAPRDAGAIANQ